jgi:hypothetical protein
VFLAFKSANLRSFFAFVYSVLEFFVVLWFLSGKNVNSLVALDSLALICAFFMTTELGVLRTDADKLKGSS